MGKFIKKPVVIEAITFDEFVEYGKSNGAHRVNGLPCSFEYKGHFVITHETDERYLIQTLERTHNFTPLDMLITGVNGEIYPCKKDIFDKTYEPVINSNQPINHMKSIIKYKIIEIAESQSFDASAGKLAIQKEARMQVMYCHDPNDPNFVYGQISSGSIQTLRTINPAVYNTWYIGAIVTCEMEIAPPVEKITPDAGERLWVDSELLKAAQQEAMFYKPPVVKTEEQILASNRVAYDAIPDPNAYRPGQPETMISNGVRNIDPL